MNRRTLAIVAAVVVCVLALLMTLVERKESPRSGPALSESVYNPYGYNCAVVFDPLEANLPEGKGTFFWSGAAGTWFWVDPTNDIVFVGMIQRMVGPGDPNLEYL